MPLIICCLSCEIFLPGCTQHVCRFGPFRSPIRLETFPGNAIVATILGRTRVMCQQLHSLPLLKSKTITVSKTSPSALPMSNGYLHSTDDQVLPACFLGQTSHNTPPNIQIHLFTKVTMGFRIKSNLDRVILYRTKQARLMFGQAHFAR